MTGSSQIWAILCIQDIAVNLNSLAWQLQSTTRVTEMPSFVCQTFSVLTFVSPC